MIRYLSHQEIDKGKWDHCIRQAGNSRIYACSWYLDVVADGQWDALVRDDYEAVCPLPFRRKWGISYIYTPFFVQQLGIFSAIRLSAGEQNEFLRAIPSRFRLCELNLNTGNGPDEQGWTFKPNRNFELDLSRSYEVLSGCYSGNLARNLKKSAAGNINIISGADPEPIIRLFRTERGRNIQHWGDKEYRIFSRVTGLCRTQEKVQVLSAVNSENEFLAGAVFFISGGRSIFIFSATGHQARQEGAMAAIIDHFISENAGQSMILDFEGSNDPGLARFYAGFGAIETVYCQAYKNQLPSGVQLIRKILKGS